MQVPVMTSEKSTIDFKKEDTDTTFKEEKKKSRRNMQDIIDTVLVFDNIKDNKNMEPKTKKCYKKVGKCYFLLIDKNGNPSIIIGPHWALFASFLGATTLLYLIVFINNLIKSNYLINHLLCISSFLLFFISYSTTSLINPGYPKNDIHRKYGQPKSLFCYCEICKFWVKTGKVTHCKECQICIEDRDHHCPWTGHCIGKNNMCSFYIFLLATVLTLSYLAFGLCLFLK